MMKYVCDVQFKQIECHLWPITDKEDKILHFYPLKYGQICSLFLVSSPPLVSRGMQRCNANNFYGSVEKQLAEWPFPY